MHGRSNHHAQNPKDNREVYVDGKPSMEYDHLKSGELAWILGRRFKNVAGGAPGNNQLIMDELSDTQRYAHQAYSGLGNGVDRMQRLASTSWVESFLADKLGDTVINLHELVVASDYQMAMNSEIMSYKNIMAGSTAIYAMDPVKQLAEIGAAANINKYADVNAGLVKHNCGIFVMELGPFLRGNVSSSKSIPMAAIPGLTAAMDAPRNLGDNLVFAAIENELRRRNLMDWTPDGIILSKLESPTDEPHKSIELDSRSAQLFNVAVQGPAITTSWTSDVRDYRLECQPMDKVFICLVADLSYRVRNDKSTGKGRMSSKVQRLVTAQNKLIDALKAYAIAIKTSTAVPSTVERDVADAVKAANQAATAVVAKANDDGDTEFQVRSNTEKKAKDKLKKFNSDRLKSKNDKDKALKEYRVALDSLEKLTDWPKEDEAALKNYMQQVEGLQQDLKEGKRFVGRAVLQNFKLMRSTSSHMANYSAFVPGKASSRCGLKLGRIFLNATTSEREGFASYIVGAWCIGTVIDSAASRSTVGTLVRTAPTSMALNLGVNIEWWSGDALYKKYMDDSGLVLMRGQRTPPPSTVFPKSEGPDGNKKRVRAYADEDVPFPIAAGLEDGDDDVFEAEVEALGSDAEDGSRPRSYGRRV